MNDEKKIQALTEQMDLIRIAIEAAYETSDKQTTRVDYLYAELAQHCLLYTSGTFHHIVLPVTLSAA